MATRLPDHPMKRFVLTATFPADDIDDAIRKLAAHWNRVVQGLDGEETGPEPFTGSADFRIDPIPRDPGDPSAAVKVLTDELIRHSRSGMGPGDLAEAIATKLREKGLLL